MNRSPRWFGIPVSLLLAACALADGRPTAAVGTDPVAYPLQAGDVLSISVWKEQELQSDVLIRPDGGISFPLAGDLPAAGRTVDDVRHELEARLTRYIPEVVVTVAVKNVLGNRIYVIGKVTRPGDYTLGRPTDVMQALSLAGGATPFADLNEIRILRRGPNGQTTAIPFRYKDVQRGRHLEQNILLSGGDTVVVP